MLNFRLICPQCNREWRSNVEGNRCMICPACVTVIDNEFTEEEPSGRCEAGPLRSEGQGLFELRGRIEGLEGEVEHQTQMQFRYQDRLEALEAKAHGHDTYVFIPEDKNKPPVFVKNPNIRHEYTPKCEGGCLSDRIGHNDAIKAQMIPNTYCPDCGSSIEEGE